MGWDNISPEIMTVIVSVILSTAIIIYREKTKNNGVWRIAIRTLKHYLLWNNAAYQNMQLQKKSNEMSVHFYSQYQQNNNSQQLSTSV